MLTKGEKVEIILIHGEDRTNRTTAEIFNTRHLERHISQATVGKIMSKFKDSGSVNNNFKKTAYCMENC